MTQIVCIASLVPFYSNYSTTIVSRHLLLTTELFYCSKYLLPACHCLWQPAQSVREKTLEFLSTALSVQSPTTCP